MIFFQMTEEPLSLQNVTAEIDEIGPTEADLKLEKVLESMA